jgi:glycerate 2-kinase
MPEICLPPFLSQFLSVFPSPILSKPSRGRTIVVGAGKAAAAMAKTVEDRLPHQLGGLVVTRHGHSVPT